MVGKGADLLVFSNLKSLTDLLQFDFKEKTYPKFKRKETNSG